MALSKIVQYSFKPKSDNNRLNFKPTVSQIVTVVVPCCLLNLYQLKTLKNLKN